MVLAHPASMRVLHIHHWDIRNLCFFASDSWYINDWEHHHVITCPLNQIWTYSGFLWVKNPGACGDRTANPCHGKQTCYHWATKFIYLFQCSIFQINNHFSKNANLKSWFWHVTGLHNGMNSRDKDCHEMRIPELVDQFLVAPWCNSSFLWWPWIHKNQISLFFGE